jgi:hypothetical protein
VVAVSHHDVVAHALEPRRQLLEYRDERVVHEHGHVLGVADHVDDLVLEQPHVDRVEHRGV